jgi:predicted RNA-binding Zn-ribbon protein involved in translation (DUF1610 family)
MSISFDCTTCGRKLKVEDEMAGRRVRCPGCGAVLEVPQSVLDAESVPAEKAEDAYAMAAPQPATEPAEKRRPCPMCGEMILADAVKCRYCGEVFDETLKRTERRKQGKAEDAVLQPVDYLLAILCSGIGCIVGIVYMIQGKPKGGKMLGLSLAFIVLWNIVSFAMRAAIQHH